MAHAAVPERSPRSARDSSLRYRAGPLVVLVYHWDMELAPLPDRRTGRDRFWTKVEVGSAAECWAWLGGKVPSGYGMLRLPEGRLTQVHRIAYTLQVGPIPEGACVHHTCRRRDCVNPLHLEVMDHREHARLHRPVAPCSSCGRAKEKTMGGRWICRPCDRLRKRA